MSNKLLTQVLDIAPDVMPSGRKFVLAVFADQANDEGLAWIAVQSERGKRDLLRKTSLSLRALQGHIKALEATGHVERLPAIGRQVKCMWIIRPSPAGFAGLWGASPADTALDPADSATIPFHSQRDPIGGRLSPPVDKCPVSGRPLPPGLSLEQWEAFLDNRFALAKPMRPYVADVLLAKLEEIGRSWVAGDVVDRSTINSWPDLYEPEEGRVTGVRRVVSGKMAEPVGGLPEEERLELSRIETLEPDARLEARRLFFERQDRRNTPASIGKIAGELALAMPPAAKRKKRA